MTTLIELIGFTGQPGKFIADVICLVVLVLPLAAFFLIAAISTWLHALLT